MSDVLDRLWAQGEARGKETTRKDMVLGMIRENVSMDVIVRVAKLSVEQIKEIAKSAAVL